MANLGIYFMDANRKGLQHFEEQSIAKQQTFFFDVMKRIFVPNPRFGFNFLFHCWIIFPPFIQKFLKSFHGFTSCQNSIIWNILYRIQFCLQNDFKAMISLRPHNNIEYYRMAATDDFKQKIQTQFPNATLEQLDS